MKKQRKKCLYLPFSETKENNDVIHWHMKENLYFCSKILEEEKNENRSGGSHRSGGLEDASSA